MTKVWIKFSHEFISYFIQFQCSFWRHTESYLSCCEQSEHKMHACSTGNVLFSCSIILPPSSHTTLTLQFSRSLAVGLMKSEWHSGGSFTRHRITQNLPRDECCTHHQHSGKCVFCSVRFTTTWWSIKIQNMYVHAFTVTVTCVIKACKKACVWIACCSFAVTHCTTMITFVKSFTRSFQS